MMHTPVRNNHTADKILSARRETFSFFYQKVCCDAKPRDKHGFRQNHRYAGYYTCGGFLKIGREREYISCAQHHYRGQQRQRNGCGNEQKSYELSHIYFFFSVI